ncbi:MAG TPA: hypothetical protein VGA08_01495, partial [Candidatus Saccharimonadales bacterium]
MTPKPKIKRANNRFGETVAFKKVGSARLVRFVLSKLNQCFLNESTGLTLLGSKQVTRPNRQGQYYGVRRSVDQFIRISRSYGSVHHALVPGRMSDQLNNLSSRRHARSYGSVHHALVPGRMSVAWILLGLFILASSLTYLLSNRRALAAAGINEQLNFQARLLNSSGGLALDGDYNVQFNIYSGGDGAPGTGDESLEWTGTHLNGNTDGVRVVNGYLTVQLGSSTSQVNTLANVDWNDDTLWLSINIGDTGSDTNCATEANFNSNCGGDGEMDPFMRLTSVPYAFNANYLDGRDSTGFVQLDPGATPQAVSTANSAIAVNQTGAGNVLRLQGGGTD